MQNYSLLKGHNILVGEAKWGGMTCWWWGWSFHPFLLAPKDQSSAKKENWWNPMEAKYKSWDFSPQPRFLKLRCALRFKRLDTSLQVSDDSQCATSVISKKWSTTNQLFERCFFESKMNFTERVKNSHWHDSLVMLVTLAESFQLRTNWK